VRVTDANDYSAGHRDCRSSGTSGLQFWACHAITAEAVAEAKVRGLAALISGGLSRNRRAIFTETAQDVLD